MKVETRIVINTPIEQAWRALIDFDAYSDWNPVMRKMTITPHLGSTGLLHVGPPNALPLIVPIKVQTYNPSEYEIMWSGNTPKLLNFVAQGKHRLKLTAINEECCELENSEAFSGIVSYALRPLHGQICKLYDLSNREFKKKVELLR